MEYVPLSFSGGQVTQLEESTLPDGMCTILQNWEPTPTDGLRARRGWKSAGTTGQPTSLRGRGTYAGFVMPGPGRTFVTAFRNTGGTQFVLDYQLYGDGKLAGSWTDIETLNVSSTYNALPVAFAAGGDVLVYSHPGFPNSGRIRKWTGGAVSDAETSGLGGRALIYHLSRFFTGGGLNNPTYLRWSEVNDPANWSTSENFIPVQQADGEPIEDIAIFDRGLVIAKENSLHYLSGLTPDAFAVQPIQTQFGVAPGRSIATAEDGVYFVSKHGVYFWNGGTFERVSRWVDFQITGSFVSTALVEDMLYIGDPGNGTTWVYDTSQGRWWKEEIDGATDAGAGFLMSYGRFLYSQPPIGATYATGVRYKDTVTGGRESDQVSGTRYEVETEQKWFGGPFGSKTHVKSFYLRYRVRGTLSPSTLLTIRMTDETGATKDIEVIPEGVGVHQIRLDTSFLCKALKVKITSVLVASTGGAGSIDIEGIEIGVLPEASKR